MTLFRAFTLAVLSLCAASTARADIVAKWTFETSVPTTAGPFAAEVNNSGGTADALGFHSGATAYSNPVGNGSNESFSSTNWVVGDYYQFSAPTISFSGIVITVDHISSSTGPRDFTLSYSTDGTTYTDAGTYSALVNAAPNNWSSATPVPASTYSFDLSSITALDGASVAYFRLTNSSTVSASGGTTASTGTSRVDNLTINGTSTTAVPEPSSMILGFLALSGFGGTRLLRRRGNMNELTQVTV